VTNSETRGRQQLFLCTEDGLFDGGAGSWRKSLFALVQVTTECVQLVSCVYADSYIMLAHRNKRALARHTILRDLLFVCTGSWITSYALNCPAIQEIKLFVK